MTAAWPAALPQRVQATDYEEQQPETLLRTQMDAGPAKVRRRFTAAPRPLRVALRMTREQVELLEAFVRDDLMDGALPFTWVHPRTEVLATLRLTAPYVLVPQARGLRWRVLLQLEVLP
jgi:hypothetical protein